MHAVCASVCVQTHTHTHTSTLPPIGATSTYIYTYPYMHTCMCVCVCVHTHTSAVRQPRPISTQIVNSRAFSQQKKGPANYYSHIAHLPPAPHTLKCPPPVFFFFFWGVDFVFGTLVRSCCAGDTPDSVNGIRSQLWPVNVGHLQSRKWATNCYISGPGVSKGHLPQVGSLTFFNGLCL